MLSSLGKGENLPESFFEGVFRCARGEKFGVLNFRGVALKGARTRKHDERQMHVDAKSSAKRLC